MATAAVSLTVRDDGSIELPEQLRAEWHLKAGDVVEIRAPKRQPIWETMSREAYLERIDEMRKRLARFAPKPGEKRLSEELMEERRAEARREREKDEAWLSSTHPQR